MPSCCMHAGYENFEAAQKVQATLIFNHVSYTDGIVLGAYFLPCGVAKASVADIPFFGTFTKVDPRASPSKQLVPVSVLHCKLVPVSPQRLRHKQKLSSP